MHYLTAVMIGVLFLVGCHNKQNGGAASPNSVPNWQVGVLGEYGYLTSYGDISEEEARDVIREMVSKYGIKEFQFYDWFSSYGGPPSADQTQWTEPYFHENKIYRSTILYYIDEIHQQGGRAWAYVQSIASTDKTLSLGDENGIYKVIDKDGNWYQRSDDWGFHFVAYFLNASWAQYMVRTWAPAVQAMGFDGIHWDTLGPIAGSYEAEANGTHAFLQEAQGLLASQYNLLQTMNFVALSWWDDNVARYLVTFPYVEVWAKEQQDRYYANMAKSLFAGDRGVMAYYPSVDDPQGLPQGQLMMLRWVSAYNNNLVYLLIGDGNKRLVNEYFPGGVPLTPTESDTLSCLVAQQNQLTALALCMAPRGSFATLFAY